MARRRAWKAARERGPPDFRYPNSWRVTRGNLTTMHYRDMFLTLNSMGREDYWVAERQTGPRTRQYSDETIADQLPAGSIYLDLGFWEGPPGNPPGPGIADLDLSRLLPAAKESPPGLRGVVRRTVEFTRGGKRWSLFIHLREPVSWKDRLLLHLVLRSFRFDPVPEG